MEQKRRTTIGLLGIVATPFIIYGGIGLVIWVIGLIEQLVSVFAH